MCSQRSLVCFFSALPSAPQRRAWHWHWNLRGAGERKEQRTAVGGSVSLLKVVRVMGLSILGSAVGIDACEEPEYLFLTKTLRHIRPFRPVPAFVFESDRLLLPSRSGRRRRYQKSILFIDHHAPYQGFDVNLT